MTDLVNHPGKFLNPDAASSLAKMEKEHGVFSISDAGRTVAYQQELINRWNQGGAANRPPYLYQPASPASASPHVQDGGKAVDFTNAAHRAWIARWGANYGWSFPIPSDPVHGVYNVANDKSRTPSTPAGSGLQDVKNRQNFLNVSRREQLVVDGIAGPATINAIKRYQTYLKTRGFYAGVIDGVWGPQTADAFGKDIASGTPTPPASGRPTIKKGSTGQAVSELQTRLNRDYSLYSKLRVDGDFGAATDSVVREFQRRSGLTVDGIVGPATWAKLGF